MLEKAFYAVVTGYIVLASLVAIAGLAVIIALFEACNLVAWIFWLPGRALGFGKLD